MEDPSIDIHVSKLLDWLVSRRHCEKHWQDAALDIRQKISHAIQDMPEHPDIVALLSGAHINYYHCLRIIEILRETEKDTKNLFGFYGSQRMKDWQEVVKLYGSKNVGLAEAAQMLVRNVTYEIPGLKKQIAKLEQTQTDCDKREQDLHKNAASMRDQYSKSCKQLGLKGEKLRSEIAHLLEELPQEFSAIAERAKDLQEALRYHKDFVPFASPGVEPAQLLPTLNHLAEHGDVTTYEWRYGEPPLRIEPPPCIIGEDEPEDSKLDEIDFGEDGGIDFGDDGGIDFGEAELATDDDPAAEIDWGGIELDTGDQIATLDSAALEEAASSLADITVEDAGVEGGVAREMEALTLLDNPHTRATIVAELMELEAFLRQRELEMRDSREEGMVATSLQHSAPGSVQLQTADGVQTMRAQTQVVLESLRTVKLQHLFLVKSSPRYVDRLVAQLRQKLETADKLEGSVAVVRQKKQDARQQVVALKPKLALITEKTRQLQTQIEQSISEKYRGRSVHLMGGVSVA